MSDTAEHRADMYSLAQSRIRAGLPSWAGRLDLTDVFHNDDMEFTAKRDVIVARIKRLPAYVTAQDDVAHPERDGYYDAETFLSLIDELAEVEDASEFDGIWSDFYDWADCARIWVKTF